MHVTAQFVHHASGCSPEGRAAVLKRFSQSCKDCDKLRASLQRLYSVSTASLQRLYSVSTASLQRLYSSFHCCTSLHLAVKRGAAMEGAIEPPWHGHETLLGIKAPPVPPSANQNEHELDMHACTHPPTHTHMYACACMHTHWAYESVASP
jgi:hypothetical protein